MKSEARKCGRPRLPIDGERVKQLAAMALTTREIALAVLCDRRTLERRFAPQIEHGRALARARVQEALFDAAVIDKKWGALKFAAAVLCGVR
jgi:hypothetical protein